MMPKIPSVLLTCQGSTTWLWLLILLTQLKRVRAPAVTEAGSGVVHQVSIPSSGVPLIYSFGDVEAAISPLVLCFADKGIA